MTTPNTQSSEVEAIIHEFRTNYKLGGCFTADGEKAKYWENWLYTTLTKLSIHHQDELREIESERRRERLGMTAMPNSVTITVRAIDDTDCDAIREVITLEQIARSKGNILDLLSRDMLSALLKSKVITKAITQRYLPTNDETK